MQMWDSEAEAKREVTKLIENTISDQDPSFRFSAVEIRKMSEAVVEALCRPGQRFLFMEGDTVHKVIETEFVDSTDEHYEFAVYTTNYYPES